jgi:signal transduction histidine kinase
VHSGLAPTPNFRVLVEGVPQTVNSLVRDDLYRIGREAIGNAFRHARARQVEVELRYDRNALALRVRDDGVGIESRLLSGGSRDGHWGLSGMRERTRGLGGRFSVWSELRQGTEIEVSIPGRVAYNLFDGSIDGGRQGT